MTKTSKTFSGKSGDGSSIGKMLLEQSENYAPDDKVNIGINMNGEVHNFTSFGELFSNREIMEKLDDLDSRMSKFGMNTNREETTRKQSQPSRQTFSYSSTNQQPSQPSQPSQQFPSVKSVNEPGPIVQSGCTMSPEAAGGLKNAPEIRQSAVQSLCAQEKISTMKILKSSEPLKIV